VSQPGASTDAARAAAPPAAVSSGVRDTGLVLGTTLLGLVGGLGVQSCLAWFMGPEARGALAVCLGFALILGVAFAPGTDRAIQYHLIAGRLALAQAIRATYTTMLVASAVAVAAGWFLIELPLPFFAKASHAELRLSLLLVAPLVLTVGLGMLLVAVRRFGALGSFNLLGTVATLVLTLLLVGALRMDVAGALLATGLATLVTIAGQTWVLRGDAQAAAAPSRRHYFEIVGYGLRFYVARLGNVVNTQIGVLLVAWLGSAEDVGLFSAASVLIMRMFVIPDSVTTALQPRIDPQRQELVAMASRVALLVTGAALAAFVAASPFVIPVLLSPAFAGCAALLAITAPGAWLKSGTRPLTAYFIGVDRPGVVSLSTAAELAANAVLTPLLFAAAGLAGAAAAAAIGYAASAAVLAIAFRRSSGISLWRTWCPRGSDLDAIRDMLDRMGWRPTRLSRPAPGLPEFSRRAILLPDRFVKRQRPALMAVELAKTRAGRAIGLETGLFSVPAVLGSDPTAGQIEFERIDDGLRMWEALRDRPADDAPVVAAARALAAIHERLELDPALAVPLPEAWMGSSRSRVFVHGDFNTLNLFLHRREGTLLVLDWQTTHLVQTRDRAAPDLIPTVGPCHFDLAWYVASLFLRRNAGLARIPRAESRAGVFVRSYFGAAHQPDGERDFADYLGRVCDLLQGLDPFAGRRLPALLRLRSARVSYPALRRLAQALSRGAGAEAGRLR
jgi:O-antigen/teichoic acid export membrane protein